MKLESTTSHKKDLSPLWLIVLLTFLMGVGTVLLVLWAQESWRQDKDSGAWKRNTAKVAIGPIDVRISATGVIRPYNQVKISPKFTGLLKKLLVKQGDSVKKGQLLAVMDDSNLLGQVQAARAAALVARSNYQKAIHGNRPQEVASSAALLSKAGSMVRHAELAVVRAQAQLQAVAAQVERDDTNARRLTDLASQGAVSDQERLNAVTQARVSRSQADQAAEELKQAESMLSQSKADLESARQQYSMMRAGFRSEDIQAARDAMVQAEGNLRFLESQLNDTRIRAPFDGIVSQKYTDEGSIVTPTTASTTLSATSSSILSLAGRLELVASVAETDIDNIKVGQPVEIIANSYPDKVFHGTVNLIAPEAIVTQNVTTFEVHATIDDDPDHQLMSGMNVSTQFLVGRKENALLIPTSCIISKQGKTGVLIPDKDGVPVFRPVKVGPISGTQTELIDGLSSGDLVFIGLTKAQLESEGYMDTSKFQPHAGFGAKGQPQIPRGFGAGK
ncbi:MAG: efflux RND transporter periplasmic adaptor subunit [Candidatus Melainabacteria bacterium]|nr:efflux RND transporter periplasmic adaptor subunit [Candidatus Melainabacteria bacterium]